MSSYGIERGNVSQPQLTQCRLYNRNTGGVVFDCFRLRVNRFDDFVDVRRDQRVGEFEEIEFQNRCNNGNFIFLKDILRNGLAVVNLSAQMVGRCEWDVNKPNCAARFITIQIRVVIIQVSQDSGYDERNSLSVCSGPSLEIYTESLF